MDDGTLRATIGDSLRELIALVVVSNTAIAQRMGLGPSDAQFLTLLTNHGPLTAGQLAQRSGLTTGTVTGVIDRLERGGYARRERDTADRRKVIVTLVPEAVAASYEHYRGYGEFLERVLSSRDSAELQAIAGFLAELTANPSGSGDISGDASR